MASIPSPAPKTLSARLGGLFRKPAKAEARPGVPPRPQEMTDLLAWPWTPLHNVEAAPFGPVNQYAVTGPCGTWQMAREAGGLRISDNSDFASAVTIGGTIRHELPGIRLTASFDVHRLGGEDSLVALVFAAHGGDRALLGVHCSGEIIVFVTRPSGAELLKQAALPPAVPGEAPRLDLEALIFGGEAILFVNGQFIGTVTDAELVGESEGAGFQVKGDADVTLKALTVAGLLPPR